MRTFAFPLICLLLAGFPLSCSQYGMNQDPPINDENNNNDENIVPAEPEWPVRVLFVIDTSTSMRDLDATFQRSLAVQATIQRLAEQEAVSVAVIGFDTQVASLTDGFVSLSGEEEAVFGDTGLRRADGWSDFDGALGTALETLEIDMQALSEEVRARTRYAVVFLTDAQPSPACFECEPDYSAWCDSQRLVYCMYTHPPVESLHECESGTCGTPEESGCGGGCGCGGIIFSDPETSSYWVDLADLPAGALPLLEDSTDYNTPERLTAWVDSIAELKVRYSVGGLALHTALLTCSPQDSTPTCSNLQKDYELDPDAARELLTHMAETGNGSFLEFFFGQAIDFSEIDLGPLGP